MFILDKDYKKSAVYLTRSHQTCYLKNIDIVCNLIKEGKDFSSLSHSDKKGIYYIMIKSYENLEWVLNFYNYLIDLVNINKPFPIKYKKHDYEEIKKLIPVPKKVGLIYPTPSSSRTSQKVYLKYKHLIASEVKDSIKLSRLVYILAGYPANVFLFGYPDWYYPMDEVIISDYYYRDKLFFEIKYVKGRLEYYASYISDSLDKVENVPKEIDSIIRYLLNKKTFTKRLSKTVDS